MTPAQTASAASGIVAASAPDDAVSRRPAGRGRAASLLAATMTIGALAVLPWVVDAYVITIAAGAVTLGLLALSTQWLAATAGLHSIGQGAYLGIGAYTAANTATHLTTSGPVQLVAAATIAATVGAVVGAVAQRARGVTYLMITLAVAELAATIAVQAHPVTGGSDGFHVPPVVPLPGLPPARGDGWAYLYVLACAVLVAAVTVAAHRSRFGLLLRGTAGHELRMRSNGHPVVLHLIAAQAFAAGIAGAAGALAAATRHYLSPTDLAFDVSALALIAAIVGGRSITATILAAAALTVVRDWAAPVTGVHAPLLLGVVLLLVAFEPLRRTHRRNQTRGRRGVPAAVRPDTADAIEADGAAASHPGSAPEAAR